ncbi:pentapeptide repeat-containing protein [Phormidium tenue]|uniref:Pentapeptide repeat-containing protein n=1 Tax=Phormidium tenue FACHB-1050 TaxID=2692857 RepID=A0ABR8CBA8_9CYAN|nr:pentapeptide repeat-containing protein [Phormidium tenue]MBD2316892.1 pentapeptide repeat-containing protein [Phormidium tenue FACHB-1050]
MKYPIYGINICTAGLIAKAMFYSALNTQRFNELRATNSLPEYFLQTLAFSGLCFGCLNVVFTQSQVLQQPLEGEKNFPYLKIWSTYLGTLRGTSYYGLDLSYVDFRNSILANTDLRACKFYRTCWIGVEGLSRAHVDNRYLDLDQPKVQKLLTTNYSTNPDFRRVNLRGVYLRDAKLQTLDFTGADLTEADLQGADLCNSILITANLSGANLQQANLRGANLTNANLNQTILKGADLREAILARAQLVNVSLAGAKLTGICIADWNLHNTNLQGVECDYIYLKIDQAGEPFQQRYFAPGKFEVRYQQNPDSSLTEVMLEDKLNWMVLDLVLAKLRREHPKFDFSIQDAGNLSQGAFVQIRHHQTVISAIVENSFQKVYEEICELVNVHNPEIQAFLQNFFGSNMPRTAGNYSENYSLSRPMLESILSDVLGLKQQVLAIETKIDDYPPKGQTVILFLSANPKNTERLQLDNEVREIDEGLQRAQLRSHFTLKQRWAVRPRDIRRALLDEHPRIVHFSGHGSGSEGLVLEDMTGMAKIVSTEAIAGLFEQFSDEIACVVLNACYSETQAKAIAQHIPFVIGMSNAIEDHAAIEFSIGFYDGILAGLTIEKAYKLGCNAIQMQGIPEHLAPVLKRKVSQGELIDL